jgi:hypothetical protein
VARLLTFAGYVARIVALQNISEIISFPDDLRIATNATVDKIPDVLVRPTPETLSAAQRFMDECPLFKNAKSMWNATTERTVIRADWR